MIRHHNLMAKINCLDVVNLKNVSRDASILMIYQRDFVLQILFAFLFQIVKDSLE